MMCVNFSLFESVSNSELCSLVSESKLVLCEDEQLKSGFRHKYSLMYIFDIFVVLMVFSAA